jgi:hypothetical protein
MLKPIVPGQSWSVRCRRESRKLSGRMKMLTWSPGASPSQARQRNAPTGTAMSTASPSRPVTVPDMVLDTPRKCAVNSAFGQA